MNAVILNIDAKAEVITNNLPAYEKWFNAELEKYEYELISDDDFAKVKEDIAELKSTEKSLKEANEQLINGSADLKSLTEKIKELSESCRTVRLAREKEVKSRDVKIKAEIVEAGWRAIDTLSNSNFKADMETAIKGKRKYSAMREAVESKANEINSRIESNRVVIELYKSEHGASIAPDSPALELCDNAEIVRERLEARVAQIKAEEEQKKAREQREAMEKKESEALAKPEPKEELSEPDNSTPKTTTETAPKQDSGIVATHSKPTGGKEEEWEYFLSEVPQIFAQFKQLRTSLDYGDNIEKANKFAQTLNTAWKELTS